MQEKTVRLADELPGTWARELELVVIDGQDAGKSVRTGAPVVRIGTAAGCDLPLADPTVSRIHCELHGDRRGVGVTDLGSTNGTSVDGVQIKEARLHPGALLRLGATTIRVAFGDVPRELPLSSRGRFGGLLGSSVAMRHVYAVLERVAPTDATVLIQGETGTGKEVAARAIHDASERAKQRFVAVDCGAIAPGLIESELFGHQKGAFSGATDDRSGPFEQAEGGTLFLDEIGELPLALQSRLLRVLEMREVRRVGASDARAVDVRVVCATNRPLARAVNDGSFREDLYYRLAVVEVELPPLRARREDIPLLAAHFYERFTGARPKLPEDVVESLLGRSWSGNVRELRNFVERGAALGWGAAPGAGAARPDASRELLDSHVRDDLPLKEARALFVETFERAYARKLLRATNGSVTRAAERAGVDRRTFQRLVARSRDDD
jgi:DNA-binding NtrC family response regulator